MWGCSPWAELGERWMKGWKLAAEEKFQAPETVPVPVHSFLCLIANPMRLLSSKETWGDRTKPVSCLSLLLDLGWLLSGAAKKQCTGCSLIGVKEQETKEKKEKGIPASSARDGFHQAQGYVGCAVQESISQSWSWIFAAFLPSSLDSLAVPSGTPPQWFIDSFLPPIAPLRPCTHNMWQLIGIC